MAQYKRKDHFHQRAKREGFRSRAAYKLEQIQRSHRVLRRGQRVADLGCWPGGWMQIAAGLVGTSGRIVGVDLAEIDPPLGLSNATSFLRLRKVSLSQWSLVRVMNLGHGSEE